MNQEFQKPKRSWPRKFADAFRGVYLGVRGQRSFRVHFLFTLAVVAAGILFQVSLTEWCLLTLCIATVLAAEMFNSALESLAKAISRQHDARLGDGLDIASAAVLTCVIGAVIVGSMIFTNRLVEMLH